MAKRDPTIEQNSHFTAKTKDGQDVEFEATLKFYISPSGQVSLSVPGGQQQSSTTSSTSVVQERTQTRDSNTGRSEANQSSSETRIQTQKRPVTDSTIDKAFPRGPEESGECSMRQFIPDPCRAVDDAVKSIKGMYNNLFSGPKCPPPENTDNLNSAYPQFNTYEHDSFRKRADVVGNEDNENTDMMENQEKYDM